MSFISTGTIVNNSCLKLHYCNAVCTHTRSSVLFIEHIFFLQSLCTLSINQFSFHHQTQWVKHQCLAVSTASVYDTVLSKCAAET